ncbi:hypothetical protein [Kribbella sp. C-35]|uniref:hypothetical protein n=1 Tax=Kribbella sp. C-35 TaxID=2789276 RepID=UPI003977EEC0
MTAESTDLAVRMRPLTIHEEGGSWIVGRNDSGDFVELPIQAITFIEALQLTGSIPAAELRVEQRHGQAIDSEGFVTSLVGLGYVESIGSHVYADSAQPPSLPWLQAHHVRFLFSRPAAVLVGLLWLAGLLAAWRRRDLLPDYSSFFVTGWNGFNIAWSTLFYLVTVAGHEFSHLAAARASNVHARFGLGTRLNLLVAETKVAGLWGAPRRTRFRVYTAGMRFDLCVMAVLSITLTWTALPTFVARSAESLILALFISIATQFALYMRTDVYFVCQELLRCKNLFGDAWAYVHFKRGRLVGDRSHESADPVLALPEREQRPVRLYAWFMLIGSGVSLTIFAGYGAPVLLRLFADSFGEIGRGVADGNALVLLNGAVVVLVEGGLQVLFVVMFVRKHGRAMRSGLRATWRRLGGSGA